MKRPEHTTLTALAAATLPTAALAHPGHGTLSGMLHALEPVHALPVIAVVLAGYWMFRRLRKS